MAASCELRRMPTQWRKDSGCRCRKELRNAVGTGANAAGQAIVTVDNTVRTSDVIFKNQQRVVNSRGAVEIVPTASEDELAVTLRGGGTGTVSLSGTGTPGATLPSPWHGGGKRRYRPQNGAHVLPALLGQGAALPDRHNM